MTTASANSTVHEPHRNLTPGKRRWVLSGCMAIMFMTAVEGSIIATAMPTIAAELGGYDLFGWAFSSFLLAQAVSIPIYGRLSDIYGRKKVFFVGAGLFTIGSAVCGLAPTMFTLIIARAVQGLGAGGIMPIGQTIIGDIYSAADRARIQGLLSSMWGISAVLGPLIGAFIVEQLSWPLVFWFNIPLAAAVIVLLAIVLPENPKRAAHRIDVAGGILLIASIGSLMLLLLQGADLGAGVAPVAVIAVAGFGLFLWQESRAPEPLLPIILWTDRILRTCVTGSLFIGAVSMGVTAFLPTFVQGVLGRDAFVAGIVLGALSLAWPIGSTGAGQLMLRTSYRTSAVLGAVLLALGGALLTQLDQHRDVTFAFCGAFVIGLGLGFTNSAFTVAVQDAAGWSVRGIATATNTFMRMLGAALGTAILAGVVNRTLDRQGTGRSDAMDILVDHARRAALTPVELDRLVAAVSHGISLAFAVTILLSLAALAFALRMPGDAKPGELAERRSGL